MPKTAAPLRGNRGPLLRLGFRSMRMSIGCWLAPLRLAGLRLGRPRLAPRFILRWRVRQPAVLAVNERRNGLKLRLKLLNLRQMLSLQLFGAFFKFSSRRIYLLLKETGTIL